MNGQQFLGVLWMYVSVLIVSLGNSRFLLALMSDKLKAAPFKTIKELNDSNFTVYGSISMIKGYKVLLIFVRRWMCEHGRIVRSRWILTLKWQKTDLDSQGWTRLFAIYNQQSAFRKSSGHHQRWKIFAAMSDMSYHNNTCKNMVIALKDIVQVCVSSFILPKGSSVWNELQTR